MSPLQLSSKVLEEASRQEALEKRLLQGQRMEAVGQLAGGMAHTFNNLLMIIAAHAELLSMGDVPPETQAKYIGTIQSTTKKAEQLTRKLLTFSRRLEIAPADFGIGELVQEATELIAPSLSKDVQLTFRRGAECWVRGDRTQLEQVVINFVLNARDAMPGGGRIVIDTSGVVVSDMEVGLHDEVPAGEYALLKIADTGEGISPENLHRIFDPFFTTKPEDRGTGLGLAMVYSAVTQSGGYIRVKSSPNTGTTFCVYLPAIKHPHAEVKRQQLCPLHESRQGDCPKLGTILVVDDEAEVRSSVRTFLEGYGLAVQEASDASEALQKADTLKESLAVLVTDAVMPGMSGTGLAHALRLRDSHLPLIFMSGYAGGEQVHQLFERATFLQKPFSGEALINAVCAGLGRCPKPKRAKFGIENVGALPGKSFRGSSPKLIQHL